MISRLKVHLVIHCCFGIVFRSAASHKGISGVQQDESALLRHHAGAGRPPRGYAPNGTFCYDACTSAAELTGPFAPHQHAASHRYRGGAGHIAWRADAGAA